MSRYGMLGHVKFCFQNTFGLIDTTSSQAFPILSETFTQQIERIAKGNMHGRFVKSKSTAGKRGVSGAVSILGYPTVLAYGLKSVFQNTSTFSGSNFHHNFDVASNDYSDYVATDMMTVEVNRNEGANSKFLQDMNGQSLTINIETGELVTFELGLLGIGQQEATATATNYLAEKPFKFDQCSIQLDGAVELDFESLSFAISNNLEVKNTLVNTFSAQKIKRTEEIGIEISGSLIVQSNSYWQAFIGQSDHTFSLNMANDDGNTFAISIPSMRILNYDSNISAAGVIEANFTAEAFYNVGSGSAILATVVNSTALFSSRFFVDDAFYGLLDQTYNSI